MYTSFLHSFPTRRSSDLDLAEDVREASVTLPSERGKIYDTNGNVLAFNRPVYRIYAILDEKVSKNTKEPQHVVDPEQTATKLDRKSTRLNSSHVAISYAV